MEMSVRVGTYAKAEQGIKDWERVSLQDFRDKDAFLEYCRELHSDEDNPKFLFQDYEMDVDLDEIVDPLISDGDIDASVWELLELNPQELNYVMVAWRHCGSSLSVREALVAGEQAYQGDYEDLESFAYKYYRDYVFEGLSSNLSGTFLGPLMGCVDWENLVNHFPFNNYIWEGGKVFYFN